MSITAKVYCNSKSVNKSYGGAMVGFAVDYSDSRNKDWAQATPSLDLKMSVANADLFVLGTAYTLTFDEDVPAAPAEPTVDAVPVTETPAPAQAPTTVAATVPDPAPAPAAPVDEPATPDPAPAVAAPATPDVAAPATPTT